ncbi:MAG: hypothetical protein AAGI03_00770 [Pseudomonadota bacterium]
MARNDNVRVVGGQWTELTNANATKANVFHQGGEQVFLQGTSSSAPPSGDAATGIPLARFEYGLVGYTFEDLFPHVSSPIRLWAWTNGNVAQVTVMTD